VGRVQGQPPAVEQRHLPAPIESLLTFGDACAARTLVRDQANLGAETAPHQPTGGHSQRTRLATDSPAPF